MKDISPVVLLYDVTCATSKLSGLASIATVIYSPPIYDKPVSTVTAPSVAPGFLSSPRE